MWRNKYEKKVNNIQGWCDAKKLKTINSNETQKWINYNILMIFFLQIVVVVIWMNHREYRKAK